MNYDILRDTLKARRKALGVTQLELADMCDLAPNTIIQLERGTGNPRLETLLKVSDTLGLAMQLVPKPLSNA